MHRKKHSKENCIFCDTDEVKISKTKGKNKGFSNKGFSIGRSEEYVESVMDCSICHRKYRALFGTNHEFLKNHVKFSDLALTDLVRLYPDLNRDEIIDIVLKNLIGVAQLLKKGQKFRTKEYNLVFEINGKRRYLHCKRDKKDFKVISVNEI